MGTLINKKSPKILITGSNGLLGQMLVDLFNSLNIDYLATSKGENRNPNCPEANYANLDICSSEAINILFSKYQPSAIIHTAAITNVDYCEENQAECQEVNVTATKFLFEAAINFKAHFQFISTDFVFDGEKGNYKETDTVYPLSIYGKSKADAEKLLLSSTYDEWSIVRTIIVFGEAENLSRSNIVLWAKSSLENGSSLTIINDQFRAPTYAKDLAKACWEIMNKSEKGIFHISGPETFSILDLVKRIAKHFNYSTTNITETDTNSLNQAAKRPPHTGFDLSKAKEKLKYQPMTFEESLKDLFGK